MTTQNVTIVVEDQNTDPVEGVLVSLFSPEGYLVGTAETNGSGQASFLLVTDGRYLVSVTSPAAGWSMTDASITVAATGVAQEFTVGGTQLVITENEAPVFCRVFGLVTPGLGMEEVKVVVTQLPSPSKNQGGTGVLYPNTFSEGMSRQYRVNSSGIWEADLEVGRFYHIEVLYTGFCRDVRIPPGFTLRNVMDLPQLLLPSEYPSLRPTS